jgi:hypothetical protein
MKKTVIFHFTYKGNANQGNKTHRKTYNMFTSKNKIINDFFDWLNKEGNDVNKEFNEPCAITNIKLIGL